MESKNTNLMERNFETDLQGNKWPIRFCITEDRMLAERGCNLGLKILEARDLML